MKKGLENLIRNFLLRKRQSLFCSKGVGFTLIELLVVIGIIGLLSTVAVVAVGNAREKAQIAKTRGDLKQLRTAIQLLEDDTGKWPNGCSINQTANPEVYLDTQQAGINQEPVVGDQGSGCTWTALDIIRWNGPYIMTTNIKDPWDNSYVFDPDYRAYENCATEDEQPEAAVIYSAGPNGSDLNAYDCDDIFTKL